MELIETVLNLAEEANQKMLATLKRENPTMKVCDIFKNLWDPWDYNILPYEPVKIPNFNGTMIPRFDNSNLVRILFEFDTFEDMGKLLDYLSENQVLETEEESWKINKVEIGFNGEVFDKDGSSDKEINLLLEKI